jgi:non-heme chloroperoxidase
VRVVVGALGLRDFMLAGFSIGGAISIRYMARHAGFGVRKLCLLAPAAPVFTQRPDYPYGKTMEEVNALLRQTETDRPQMLVELSRDFFASAIRPEFRNWFIYLGLEGSGHGTAKALIALRDEDVRADLPYIRVSTGIFHGAEDKIVPYESAMTLHQRIPGSELFRFDHSGHGVVYDELDRFNRTFVQYLAK